MTSVFALICSIYEQIIFSVRTFVFKLAAIGVKPSFFSRRHSVLIYITKEKWRNRITIKWRQPWSFSKGHNFLNIYDVNLIYFALFCILMQIEIKVENFLSKSLQRYSLSWDIGKHILRSHHKYLKSYDPLKMITVDAI